MQRIPANPESLSKTYPRVLIVAASLRIMGGQAVMAERLVYDLRNDGVPVRFLPIDAIPRYLQFVGKIKYLRTIVNTIFYVFSLLLTVWRYDTVQVFSASYWSFLITPVPAILVAKLYGKTVILNYHSGEAEDHLRRSGRLVHWLLKLPDEIVVPSVFLVEVFRQFGFKSRAIANNVDLGKFAFVARTAFAPKILIPRALEPLYNIGCSIRAFRIVKNRFPEARLTILGTGSQRRQLEEEVRHLGLTNVVFAGRIEHDDLPEIYASHDIFLNTSSIDNMPVSILEAFAAGLPVVTTRAGGIPYIVTHDVTGCLFDLNDCESAAKHIQRLVDDPKYAIKLTHAAKAQLQKYQWETVASQWKSIYSQLFDEESRKCGSLD